MKHIVFDKYAEAIADKFRIQKSELFLKTKRREMVDARFLLFYLCFKRPMRISNIVSYAKEAGYDVNHSNIIYGISSIAKRIKEDKDYSKIVKAIEERVSI